MEHLRRMEDSDADDLSFTSKGDKSHSELEDWEEVGSDVVHGLNNSQNHQRSATPERPPTLAQASSAKKKEKKDKKKKKRSRPRRSQTVTSFDPNADWNPFGEDNGSKPHHTRSGSHEFSLSTKSEPAAQHSEGTRVRRSVSVTSRPTFSGSIDANADMFAEHTFALKDLLRYAPASSSWVRDDTFSPAGHRCQECQQEFSWTKKKHHCYYCGAMFCSGCLTNRKFPELGFLKTPLRVCNDCTHAKFPSEPAPPANLKTKLENTEAEASELRTSLKTLTLENEKLRGRVSRQSEEIRDLNSRVEAQHTQAQPVDKLRQELEAEREEHTQLKYRLRQMQMDFELEKDSLVSKAHDLSNLNDQLSLRLQTSEQALDQVKAEKARSDAELTTLREEKLERALSKAQHAVTDESNPFLDAENASDLKLQEMHIELEALKLNYVAETSRAREVIAAQESETRTLQKKLAVKKKQAASLQWKLVAKTAVLERALQKKPAAPAADGRLEQLRRDLEQQTALVEEQRTLRQKASEDAKQARAELAALTAQYDDLKGKLVDMQSKYLDLQSNSKERVLKKQLREKTALLEDAQRDLASAKQDLTDLQDKHLDVEQELYLAQKAMRGANQSPEASAAHKKQLETLNQRITEQDEMIDDLRSRLQDASVEKHKLAATISQLRARTEDLQQAVSTHNADNYSQWDAQLQPLHDRVSELDEQTTVLRQDLHTSQKEVHTLRKQLNSVNEKLHKAESEVEAHAKELTFLRETKERLDKYTQDLQADVSALTQQRDNLMGRSKRIAHRVKRLTLDAPIGLCQSCVPVYFGHVETTVPIRHHDEPAVKPKPRGLNLSQLLAPKKFNTLTISSAPSSPCSLFSEAFSPISVSPSSVTGHRRTRSAERIAAIKDAARPATRRTMSDRVLRKKPILVNQQSLSRLSHVAESLVLDADNKTELEEELDSAKFEAAKSDEDWEVEFRVLQADNETLRDLLQQAEARQAELNDTIDKHVSLHERIYEEKETLTREVEELRAVKDETRAQLARIMELEAALESQKLRVTEKESELKMVEEELEKVEQESIRGTPASTLARDCGDHLTEIMRLKAREKELMSAKAGLEEKLRTQTNALETVLGEFNAVEARLKEADKALKSSQDQILHKEDRIEELNKRLIEMAEELSAAQIEDDKGLHDRVLQLEADLKAAQSQKGRSAQRAVEAEEHIAATLMDLHRRNEDLRTQLEESTPKASDKTNTLKSLDAEAVVVVRETAQALHDRVAELLSEKKALHQEMEKIREEAADDIAFHQMSLTTITAERDLAKEQQQKLQARVDSLKSQLDTIRQEHQKSYDQYDEETTDLQFRLAEVEHERDSMMTDQTLFKTKYEESEKKLQAVLETAALQLSQVEKEKSRLLRKNKDLMVRVRRMKGRAGSADVDSNDAHDKEMEALRKELERAIDDRDAVMQQLDEAVARERELETKFNKLNQQTEPLAVLTEELLASMDGADGSLKQALKKLTAEHKRMLEASREELNEKNEEIQAILETAAAQVEVAENERDMWRRKYKEEGRQPNGTAEVVDTEAVSQLRGEQEKLRLQMAKSQRQLLENERQAKALSESQQTRATELSTLMVAFHQDMKTALEVEITKKYVSTDEKERIVELEQKLADVYGRIGALTVEKDAAVERLQKHLEKHKERMLEKEEQHQDTRAKAKQTVQSVQKKLDKMQRERDDVAKKLREALRSKKKQQERLDQLEDDLINCHKQLGDIATEKNSWKRKQSKLLAEISALKDRVDEATKARASYEKKLFQFATALSDPDATDAHETSLVLDETKQHLEQLTEERDELMQKEREWGKKELELKTLIAQLIEEEQKLSADNKRLKESHMEVPDTDTLVLKQQLDRSNTRAENLAHALESAEAEKKSLSAQLTTIRERHAEVQTSLVQDVNKLHERLNAFRQSASGEKHRLSDELTKTLEDVNQLQTKNTKLTQDNSRLNAGLVSTKAKLERAQTSLDEVQRSLAESKARCQKLEADAKHWQSQFQQTMTRHTLTAQQSSSKEQQLAEMQRRYETQIANLQSRIPSAADMEKYTALVSELEDAHNQLDDLETEKEELEKAVVLLREMYTEAKSQIASEQQGSKKMSQEIKALTSQVAELRAAHGGCAGREKQLMSQIESSEQQMTQLRGFLAEAQRRRNTPSPSPSVDGRRRSNPSPVPFETDNIKEIESLRRQLRHAELRENEFHRQHQELEEKASLADRLQADLSASQDLCASLSEEVQQLHATIARLEGTQAAQAELLREAEQKNRTIEDNTLKSVSEIEGKENADLKVKLSSLEADVADLVSRLQESALPDEMRTHVEALSAQLSEISGRLQRTVDDLFTAVEKQNGELQSCQNDFHHEMAEFSSYTAKFAEDLKQIRERLSPSTADADLEQLHGEVSAQSERTRAKSAALIQRRAVSEALHADIDRCRGAAVSDLGAIHEQVTAFRAKADATLRQQDRVKDAVDRHSEAPPAKPRKTTSHKSEKKTRKAKKGGSKKASRK